MAIALLGFTIQLGELWIVFGATIVLILASRDFKTGVLIVTSVIVLYLVNSADMREFWIIAVFGLLIVAYLLGLGKEEAPADPYSGLLGGFGGGVSGE